MFIMFIVGYKRPFEVESFLVQLWVYQLDGKDSSAFLFQCMVEVSMVNWL